MSRHPSTPLEGAPRLSEVLGGPRILFKRDDLTGFALGGNKVRKLEYLLAEVVDQNADVVVTGAGPQSNYLRTTAAAARKLGLDAVLVMHGDPPQRFRETTCWIDWPGRRSFSPATKTAPRWIGRWTRWQTTCAGVVAGRM